MLSHTPHTREGAHRCPAGFTLVEVLLVVVITTLLMYSMSMIFQKASLIVGVSEAEIETRQKARNIFSRLELDLGNAFVDNDGNYFEITGGQNDSSLKFVTTTKYNPEGLIGRVDVTQVLYKKLNGNLAASLQATKGIPGAKPQPLIVRYALTYLSEQDAADYGRSAHTNIDLAHDGNLLESLAQYVDIVATNVTEFRVQSLNKSQVIGLSAPFSLTRIDSYWNLGSTQELPKAIRVRVGLSDGNGVVNRTFESIIYPKFTRKSL